MERVKFIYIGGIYFDHIVAAKTHIATYPVKADQRNTETLKKVEGFKGKKTHHTGDEIDIVNTFISACYESEAAKYNPNKLAKAWKMIIFSVSLTK